ncbi:MAG: carbohydrate kinase family protein [Actinomycetota bacterium]
MNPDLVVVGDLLLDVTVDAPELAAGGDVHGTVLARPGGSGANAAVWAAHEGARVRFHGRVGDDPTGRILLEGLARHGVDAAVAVAPGERTGCMLIVRLGDERSMVADRGANERLSPDDVPARLEAAAVLVSGYLLFHPSSEPAALAALDRARAGIVAVEAASWPLVDAYGAGHFLESTAGATLILANAREAHALTGLELEAAAKELSERYEAACVKLGAAGALFARGGRVVHVPAPEIEVRDTTGAGDAFDGAMLAALARGAEPEAALTAGCRAGAAAAASDEAWPTTVRR